MSKHQERDYVEHLKESKVKNIEVVNELKKSFISYAMAVNVSRAIPDVRDGLKPVHRRILYSMSELGLTSDHAYRKCALIVGDVLGKYHPHGDSSVYDALVRLAQDFSIRLPLIDGHGNFGSVDGDPPAAYRYTEARLSKAASEMIRDLDKNTVDFYPNFDDTRMQPSVLPSRYPNVLVNGADGIAVGMATSIPPHNLGEVVDATVALINNPDLTVDELCEFIPSPDYPTGAIVLGRAAIRQAYRTGRGAAIIRARSEIEELSNGRTRIVITELPYQVNKARLIETIAEQVKEKRIDGISDISEETDRSGMRIVIDCKRDANPQVVLNTLYKQTNMQITNSMILLALDDGVPRIMNLKQILEAYVAHQITVITRRVQFELTKAQEREHILHGLAIALANIDEVIATIKKSQDRNDAMQKLMQSFLLSDKQANAVLTMQLQKLSGLEVEKINDELAQKQKEIAEYKKILSDETYVREIIIEEMSEVKTKYGTPRRSELSYDHTEINIADLIDEEDIVVTMTHTGYIKRQPVTEYRSQRRGGMGITAHRAKDEDFIEQMLTTNTHEDILFFTSIGKVFALKGYEIPEAQRIARGRAVINLLQLQTGEKISAMLPFAKEHEGYLMMATRNGLVKKTPLKEFESIKRNGKRAITLVDDDELISAVITSGSDELIMAATNGLSIRFSEKQVRPMGRNAQGVKSMKLKDDYKVVDMSVICEGCEILTVTEKGYGKRSAIEDYPLQGRAGQGVKAGVFNKRTGKMVNLKVIPPETDVMLIADNGIAIRVQADEISKIGRATQGVRIMKLKEECNVASIALTPHEDEEEFDEEQETMQEQDDDQELSSADEKVEDSKEVLSADEETSETSPDETP